MMMNEWINEWHLGSSPSGLDAPRPQNRPFVPNNYDDDDVGNNNYDNLSIALSVMFVILIIFVIYFVVYSNVYDTFLVLAQIYGILEKSFEIISFIFCGVTAQIGPGLPRFVFCRSYTASRNLLNKRSACHRGLITIHHTTKAGDEYPCPQRDWKPQSIKWL
jgi:hypothetical protein